MTDNEIVKALECCYTIGTNCKECPLNDEEDCNDVLMANYVRDLINRQKAELERKDIEIDILIKKKEALKDDISELQAEVERLQKIIVGFMDEVGTWSNKYDVDVSNIHKLPLLAKEDWNIRNNIKYEAIKEFAERLKEELRLYTENNGGFVPSMIDNLVKEMVGEKDV